MTHAVVTLAGGCFWCIEPVFHRLRGVESAVSGYMGGHTSNPTYQDVCNGDTGHAEVVQLTFDPDVISFRNLLDVFFTLHDPTQLNRQGNDIGTQYRSAIFPHSAEQEREALDAIDRARPDWPEPIVTAIEPLGQWWPAEDYHQEYWQGDGQRNPYCLAVIPPKLRKLRKSFAARSKEGATA